MNIYIYVIFTRYIGVYIQIFISCVLVFQKSRGQPDCFQQPDTYIIVGSMRHAAGLALWICAAGAAVDLVLFCRFFFNSDATRLQTWTGLSGFLCFVPVISQPPRRVRRSCCWAKARDGILWIPVQIDPSDSKQCWLVNPETPETQRFLIFFPVFFPPVFLYSRYAIQRCLLLMPSSLPAFFQKTLAGRTGEPIWLSNWRFFCESAESQHSENPMSLSPGVLGSIQETLANLRSRECVEGGCSKCQPQYLKVKHWTLKRGGMKCCWNLHFLSWCLPLSWAFSWGFRGTFWNSPDPAQRCETFGCSAFLAFGREGTDVSRVPPCQLPKICESFVEHLIRCLGFQMPSGSSILAIHSSDHPFITAKSVVFLDLRSVLAPVFAASQELPSAWAKIAKSKVQQVQRQRPSSGSQAAVLERKIHLSIFVTYLSQSFFLIEVFFFPEM